MWIYFLLFTTVSAQVISHGYNSKDIYVFPNREFIFSVYVSRPISTFQWKINNTNLEDINITNLYTTDVARFDFATKYLIYMSPDLLSTYDSFHISCEVYSAHTNQTVYCETIIIKVQPTVDAPRYLNVDNLRVKWKAPFSNTIWNSWRPYVWYDIQIQDFVTSRNIYCKDCTNIRKTSYDLRKSAIRSSIYKITVTSKNGAGVGNSSEIGFINFPTEAPTSTIPLTTEMVKLEMVKPEMVKPEIHNSTDCTNQPNNKSQKIVVPIVGIIGLVLIAAICVSGVAYIATHKK